MNGVRGVVLLSGGRVLSRRLCPKHRTCWISTSFSNYPKMCSLGCTLRIKDPLIKANPLFPIPFITTCNYHKYWPGIGNSSFFPVQF